MHRPQNTRESYCHLKSFHMYLHCSDVGKGRGDFPSAPLFPGLRYYGGVGRTPIVGLPAMDLGLVFSLCTIVLQTPQPCNTSPAGRAVLPRRSQHFHGVAILPQANPSTYTCRGSQGRKPVLGRVVHTEQWRWAPGQAGRPRLAAAPWLPRRHH